MSKVSHEFMRRQFQKRLDKIKAELDLLQSTNEHWNRMHPRRGTLADRKEKYMTHPLVYLAGPYRGRTVAEVTANIRRAEKYAVHLMQAGYYVLCPHKNTAHLDGCVPDEFFLEMGLEHLRRCDAIFVMPGSEASAGTQAEIAEAKRLGMKAISFMSWDDGSNSGIIFREGEI